MGEIININMNRRDDLVEGRSDQIGRGGVIYFGRFYTNGRVKQPCRSSHYYLTCRIDTDSCVDWGEDSSRLSIIKYIREYRIADKFRQLYQVGHFCIHFA